MLATPPSPSFRGLLYCLTLAVVTTGCVSMEPSTQPREDVQQSSTDLSSSDVEARLHRAAEQWNDVPHRLGGNSVEGVDCSGLVQSVFEEELSVSLPRTTEEQAKVGQNVDASSLQPGDLVFFRPSNRDRHVGIYLSDGKFLHASSSEGVTTSSLRSDYWSDRWWQARRVLSSSSTPSSDSSNTVNSSKRKGW